MDALPFLKLGKPKTLYLIYRAAGLEPDEIMPMLPGRKDEGMSVRTLEGWRQKDEVFREAEENVVNDPFWCHRHIVLPLKLAALDMHDVQYLLGLAKDTKGQPKEFKGFSSKKEELILQETGLLNAAAAPGAELKDIIKSVGNALADSNIKRRPKIIEVTPEVVHGSR